VATFILVLLTNSWYIFVKSVNAIDALTPPAIIRAYPKGLLRWKQDHQADK